jgi:lipopolysaccharide transport system ATP-binding protein
MDIRVRYNCAASILAVDIQDALGASIMQALPSLSPLVPGEPGRYTATAEIMLPPLIPATYWVTFWMGPHNTVTYDTVSGALSFDVIDSPTPGRTFPHSADHGYIVPPSRCVVTVAEQTLELTA